MKSINFKVRQSVSYDMSHTAYHNAHYDCRVSLLSYTSNTITILSFFNCYLAVPRPTLGHSQGDSLTNPMLITSFIHILPEGHWEPGNEPGSQIPTEHLVGLNRDLLILIAIP